MRKGVIYARYSSHNQREESIEQQIDACRAFAAENDIRIVDIYADKAISGKTDKRASFQRLMRDAERRKFEVVVAYKSNRIARNMFNALTYENRLADYGIDTLYAKEEFGNTAAGRFALRTMMNVNQFYSENMSEDIRRGLKDNAEHLLVNGNLPYGYIRGENQKHAVDPEKAAVVREIFERYSHGERFISIAQDLNARGYKTKNGNPWNKGSFHRMLKNDIYIGTYRNCGVVVENAIPPIIDRALFDAVQAKLDERRPYAKNYNYLLTGKLFCGHCGSPMVGTSGKTVNGAPLYHYYSCQGKRLRHDCEKAHEIQEELERRVADLTRNIVLQDEFIEWIAEQAVSVQRLNANEAEISRMESAKREKEKAVKNILTAIEQGIFTASTKDRLLELESEIKDLKDGIALFRANNRPLEKERIIFALQKFRDEKLDSPNFCKVLIDTFVERVTVWDDKIKVDYFYTADGKSVISESPKVEKAPPFSTCTNLTVLVYVHGFSLLASRS